MDCETNKKNASPSEYQNAKSHHKESVSSIEKGHSIELAHAIKQLHDKFALTLAKKAIEYKQNLDAHKSIDSLTSACIQDDLENELAEHSATKKELSALHELMNSQKSANDKILMIKQFELDTEKAKHAETKDELSKFNGIDAARALTEHINEMQFFINSMRHELQNSSIDGVIDMRTRLLLKDMHDSLLLKTTSNYQCLFISEEACRMGMKFTTPELGEIGKPIAKRVNMTEQTDKPGKHKQFVDGHVTWVNTYSQKSQDVIRDELKKAWSAKRARIERS